MEKDKITSIKMYDACNQKKHFGKVSGDKLSLSVYKSAIMKDAIKFALKANIRKYCKDKTEYGKRVMEYMMTRYSEPGFENYQQKQAQLLLDWHKVMRYLNSEQRYLYIPEPGTVEFAGKEFTVKPDLAYSLDGKTDIELITIKTGKVYFKKKEDDIERDLRTYLQILYAKKLGYKDITISYYHLTKEYESDCSNWSQCAQSFSGGNIIKIKDGELAGGDAYNPEQIEILKEFVTKGEDKSECDKNCSYCPLKDICEYTLPATKISEIEAVDETAKEVVDAMKEEVKYTKQQQQVIAVDKGVWRVLAAAGSGKTQTVAARVAKLIEDGVKPEEILCITFSNAGAKEMRRKIGKIIDDVDNIKICTFAAFSFETAADNAKELGFKKKLSVIDDVSRYPIIEEILNKHPILKWRSKSFLKFDHVTTKRNETKGALQIVSEIFMQIKDIKHKNPNAVIDSDDIAYDAKNIPPYVVDEIIDLYDVYASLCMQYGYIELDDLEYYGLQVLQNNSGYLDEKYNFKHIIIDEFQDTSENEMEIVKHLVLGKSFESLMIVGDDSQSVYKFRGTSSEFILNFEYYINQPVIIDGVTIPRTNPIKVNDIMLDLNFRSGQSILDWAGKLLENNGDENIKKDVVGARGVSGEVHIKECALQKDEMNEVVKQILEDHNKGIAFEDMAVLSFTKTELKNVADALTKSGIPSTFAAPEPVINNSRVKAVLAFARAYEKGNIDSTDKDVAIAANAIYRAENVSTDVPFLKLNKNEIELRCEEVIGLLNEIRDFPEWNPEKKKAFLDYIERISIEDEAIEYFMDMFKTKDFEDILKYCKDFERFGEGMELRYKTYGPGVRLTTAHSSKGLEWKQIYLLVDGFNNPFANDTEESRRLLYVAMTRARDELFVYGVGEIQNKNSFTSVPSRVLAELQQSYRDEKAEEGVVAE